MDVDAPPQLPQPTIQPTQPSYYRIVYHPASGREPEVFSLDGEPSQPQDPGSYAAPERPWEPFCSQADFDFAEYASINRLSDVQINDLLTRMRKLWASDVHISMQNARDVHKSWDQAASVFPTVCV